jgi:NTE family protein
VYGPEFMQKLNGLALRRGDPAYRRVETLIVRPSEDIGRLAATYVRSGKIRGGAAMARRLFTLVDVGESTEADLASYLLFDGDFARKLIELGHADAAARRHEIAEFFGSAEEDAPPEMAEGDTFQIPRPVG